MISPLLISYSYGHGGSLARYQHVFFLVDRDAILGEDGDVSIVVGFTTLIKDVGILLSESALAVSLDMCGRESLVSHFTLFVPAVATPTRFIDRQIIGIPVFNLSPLLI